MEKLKIGYFADGPWSHRALRRLLADLSLEVRFVCARFDKPDEILKQLTIQAGLDFITHRNVNSQEFLERLDEYKCDLFVSMSFNQIFRSTLIRLPRLQTINCHAGKLPFYRGRNVLNWVLINDESDFGITVHYVDEGIDTGDIICQTYHSITDQDNYNTLLYRAYEGCSETLYRAVKLIQSNNVRRIAQDTIHPTGFYCTQRKTGDEYIDWNQSSRGIFNFVRAICNPGPEARTFLRGTELRINKVEWLPSAASYKCIVGSVVGVDENSFCVKTNDNFIKVVEWSGIDRLRIGDRLG